MKKKSKNLPTPEYDPKREQNVLLEKIAQDVKTVAEGHGGIIKRLDNLESEVKFIKTAVMENGADIKVLKKGQEELKVGQKNIELDVKNFKDGQKRIEQKLDTVTTDHEQRLQKLEAV